MKGHLSALPRGFIGANYKRQQGSHRAAATGSLLGFLIEQDTELRRLKMYSFDKYVTPLA